MKKKISRMLSVLFALTVVLAAGGPAMAAEKKSPADEAAKRWAQYEPSFKAFADADRAAPPVKGGVLFVGSSIFRQWKEVAEHMAPLPVLNRAFGGSRTGDQVARFDQVVLPYAPKVIVYYCGSNDLKAGTTPEDPAAIFGRFREFSVRVQKFQPTTRIIYVTATRSPDRVARWEQVDHYNALVRAYCAATPHHTFIDINPALVDAHGHPRLELYVADKLHFQPATYLEFTKIIKPVLQRVWDEAQGDARR